MKVTRHPAPGADRRTLSWRPPVVSTKFPDYARPRGD